MFLGSSQNLQPVSYCINQDLIRRKKPHTNLKRESLTSRTVNCNGIEVTRNQLVKGKRTLKTKGIANNRNSQYLQGCDGATKQKHPLHPRNESRPCWKGTAVVQSMAGQLLWCCAGGTCWKSVLGGFREADHGEVSNQRYSTTNHLRGVPGQLLGAAEAGCLVSHMHSRN